MDATQLGAFEAWFNAHARSHACQDPAGQANLDLKTLHTLKVMEEITALAKVLGLPESEIPLAKAAALFHDVGRYTQYTRYRTFSDLKSQNHARLSLNVLAREHVLKGMEREEKSVLVYAIAWHNRPFSPKKGNPRKLLFAKMLRDADKLDIYRVVSVYYRETGKKRNGAVEHGLPDLPAISPEVEADILARRPVQVRNMRTLNDFKLFQVGWVFDVNFRHTFSAILKRGYLDMLQSVLPDTRQVETIFEAARKHVDGQLAGTNRKPESRG
jgi:HD superfamily phosphohydrolase YqeK